MVSWLTVAGGLNKGHFSTKVCRAFGEGFLTWFWIFCSAWFLFQAVWKAIFIHQNPKTQVRSKELGLQQRKGSFGETRELFCGLSSSMIFLQVKAWPLFSAPCLCLELHNLTCASVAPSPIRLAQVNDLQHLGAGNCLTSGDASCLAGATLFFRCLSPYPAWFSKLKPWEPFWEGTE